MPSAPVMLLVSVLAACFYGSFVHAQSTYYFKTGTDWNEYTTAYVSDGCGGSTVVNLSPTGPAVLDVVHICISGVIGNVPVNVAGLVMEEGATITFPTQSVAIGAAGLQAIGSTGQALIGIGSGSFSVTGDTTTTAGVTLKVYVSGSAVTFRGHMTGSVEFEVQGSPSTVTLRAPVDGVVDSLTGGVSLTLSVVATSQLLTFALTGSYSFNPNTLAVDGNLDVLSDGLNGGAGGAATFDAGTLSLSGSGSNIVSIRENTEVTATGTWTGTGSVRLSGCQVVGIPSTIDSSVQLHGPTSSVTTTFGMYLYLYGACNVCSAVCALCICPRSVIGCGAHTIAHFLVWVLVWVRSIATAGPLSIGLASWAGTIVLTSSIVCTPACAVSDATASLDASGGEISGTLTVAASAKLQLASDVVIAGGATLTVNALGSAATLDLDSHTLGFGSLQSGTIELTSSSPATTNLLVTATTGGAFVGSGSGTRELRLSAVSGITFGTSGIVNPANFARLCTCPIHPMQHPVPHGVGARATVVLGCDQSSLTFLSCVISCVVFF